MKNSKKVVLYHPSDGDIIEVGHRAFVWPINHPSSLVSNTSVVATSPVIRYDEDTGEFETFNSIYKPEGGCDV